MTMASGMYGLTLEKILLDTAALSLESETDTKALLVTDSETPNFNTHDFRADISAEVANGNGYTTGGKDLTTTEVAVSAGYVNWTFDNLSWTTSSFTARGLVAYFDVGASATDMLIAASAFSQDYTSQSGMFAVTIDANGYLRFDIIP